MSENPKFRYMIGGEPTICIVSEADLETRVRTARDKGAALLVRDIDGRVVAAIVPRKDYKLLRRIRRRSEDRADIAAAHAALRDVAENGSLSLEEVKAEIGL